MSTEEDDAVLAAVAAVIIEAAAHQRFQRRPRRFWIRPSIRRGRQKYSASDMMKDLLLNEVDELNLEYRSDVGFQNFFRMKNSDFEVLLRMIGREISRQNTSFREAIPPNERLAVTLRFLATGDSYHSLMYNFKISKQCISRTIPEVCVAIINALQDYVKMPRTETEWELVAKQFNDKWNFPNCVGAIDGKHVTIQAPMNSGSEFFNYKSFFSVVLLAVVDANYNFIYANVGAQGRISDGGIFNNSALKRSLDENSCRLPPPRKLPGRNISIPYVLVGDEAFALSKYLMKPFSGMHDKGSRKRIFNYRLSRARRVSENGFGILSSSFRIFRKPMLLEPDTATKVTLAAVHLHNFLTKTSSRSVYSPVGMLDTESSDTGEVIPGFWGRDTSTVLLNDFQTLPRRSTNEAQTIRDEFVEYFCSPEGELIFQYDK